MKSLIFKTWQEQQRAHAHNETTTPNVLKTCNKYFKTEPQQNEKQWQQTAAAAAIVATAERLLGQWEKTHTIVFCWALSSGCKTKKKREKLQRWESWESIMGWWEMMMALFTYYTLLQLQKTWKTTEERKKERDRTKWVHLLQHQAFLSFVFFFSDKSLLAPSPNTSSTAAAALAAEETLLSHSPSLSLSLSLSQIHVHTYIHTFIHVCINVCMCTL